MAHDSTREQPQEEMSVPVERLTTVELFLGHPEALRKYRAVGGSLPFQEKKRGLVLGSD